MTLFECTVRYDKTLDDGTNKKVTEAVIIDAQSFSEAEARAISETSQLTRGEAEVLAIKRSSITEVHSAVDEAGSDKFFKAKIVYITIDEKTAKVKRQPAYILVYAADIDKAHRAVVNIMQTSVVDYEIATLDETKFTFFYSHG